MRITLQGMGQGDLYDMLLALANRCFTNAGLAVATTTTQVQIANAIQYCLNGQNANKAATDNIAVSGLTNTSATQYRKVRVEINASGTVSFKEGPAASGQALAEIPRRSESKCTIGWIEIPNNFTYGTTAFSVAGVTFKNGDPDLGDGIGVPPSDRGITTTVRTGP